MRARLLWRRSAPLLGEEVGGKASSAPCREGGAGRPLPAGRSGARPGSGGQRVKGGGLPPVSTGREGRGHLPLPSTYRNEPETSHGLPATTLHSTPCPISQPLRVDFSGIVSKKSSPAVSLSFCLDSYQSKAKAIAINIYQGSVMRRCPHNSSFYLKKPRLALAFLIFSCLSPKCQLREG